MSSPLLVEIQWLQEMRDDFERKLADAQGRYRGSQQAVCAEPQPIMESLPQPSALSLPADTTTSQKQSLTIPLTPTNSTALPPSPATTSASASLLETTLPSLPQFLATSPAGPSGTRNRRSSDIFSDFKLPAPSERPLSDAVVERIKITSPQTSIPSMPIPSQAKITVAEMAAFLGIPLKDPRETALAIMALGLPLEELLDLSWDIGHAVNSGSIPGFTTYSGAPAAQDWEQLRTNVEKTINQSSIEVALKTGMAESEGTSNLPENGTNPSLPKEFGKLEYEGEQETSTTRGPSTVSLNTNRAFQNVFTKTIVEVQCQLRADNQEPHVVPVPENILNSLDNGQELWSMQAKGKETVNADQRKFNIMLSSSEESQVQRPFSKVNGKEKATTATTAQGKVNSMLSVPTKEQNALGSMEEIQIERLCEGIRNDGEEEERQIRTLDSQDSEKTQTGKDIKCRKITSIVADEKTIPVDPPCFETKPAEKSEINTRSPCCSRTSSPVPPNSDSKGLILPCDGTNKSSINHTGARPSCRPRSGEGSQFATPSVKHITLLPQRGSKTSEESIPLQATAPLNKKTRIKHQHASSNHGESTFRHINNTPNDHNRANFQCKELGSNDPLVLTAETSHANAPVEVQSTKQVGRAPSPQSCGNPVGHGRTSLSNESTPACSKPGGRRTSRPCNGRFVARSLRDCLRHNTTTNSPTAVESSEESINVNLQSQPLQSQHLGAEKPNPMEIVTLEQLFQSSTDASKIEKPVIRIPHGPTVRVAAPSVAGTDVTPQPIIPWESRALREAPPHVRAKAKLARGRYVDILGNGVNACAGWPVPQVPGVEWYFAQTRH